jgi:hypothetical protein
MYALISLTDLPGNSSIGKPNSTAKVEFFLVYFGLKDIAD